MAVKYFYKNEEIALQQINDKMSRKILAHDNPLMVVEVHFEKGAVGSIHAHVHEQAAYCVKGQLEFTVGDEKCIINPGDSIYMPSNIDHGCVALEDTILLDIFTPQREDFL